MVKIFLLSLVTLLTTANKPVHDFHLSKCLIEYSVADQAVQITMYMFLDDLEEALRQQGKDKLFICSGKEHPEAENYLFQYIQQQFKIAVNEESVNFEFVGKEQSEDLQAVWCYLEVLDISNFKSIEVHNSILMEIFDDQQNIVQISAPDKKQGYFLFQKGQESDKVSFK